MAKPTITYGVSTQSSDCDDATGWNLTNSGLVGPTHTVLHGDIFQLQGTCNDAGDEFCYIEKDITDISSNVFDTWVVRYKTSDASNALSAKVDLIFTVGSQTLIPSGTFSTSWTYATGTITSGKTIDKIRFYAQDSPNSVDSGTYEVWYDFILLCGGIFTFPYVNEAGRSGGIDLEIEPRYAHIPIPGRMGDITQYLGMPSPTIRLSGDMDTNTAWGTPDGESLYKIVQEAYNDKFNWFTSDMINCKVTPGLFKISQRPGSKSQRLWSWVLRQYSLSCGSETTWGQRDWWGI